MNRMFLLRTRRICALALLTTFALSGCGGSGGVNWDDFQPRNATADDLSSRAFDFSWLPDGNPIDPDLGPMTVNFGVLDADGEGSFTLTEEDGGSATGTVDLDSPTLRFVVQSTVGTIGLTVGQTISIRAEADLDDGRIRLTDESRNVEATSYNRKLTDAPQGRRVLR